MGPQSSMVIHLLLKTTPVDVTLKIFLNSPRKTLSLCAHLAKSSFVMKKKKLRLVSLRYIQGRSSETARKIPTTNDREKFCNHRCKERRSRFNEGCPKRKSKKNKRRAINRNIQL